MAFPFQYLMGRNLFLCRVQKTAKKPHGKSRVQINSCPVWGFSLPFWIFGDSPPPPPSYKYSHRTPLFLFTLLITLLACFCSIFAYFLVYLYLPIYNDFRTITHSSTRKHYISQFTIAIMISVRNKCSCL